MKIDEIPRLPAKLAAPASLGSAFVGENEAILHDAIVRDGRLVSERAFLRSGLRRELAFDPREVHAGVVTCGGLCPGINDVIRELVMCLWHVYGVRRITGIPFGYRGFFAGAHPDVALDPDFVDKIHHGGGSALGSSRGGADVSSIVDGIARRGLNQVYVIGGDGTQRGAFAVSEECRRRGLPIAVAGVPKTVDNDISLLDRSFGFETAVEAAALAMDSMHTEAKSAERGVGLLKLMGRESGFIAAHAVLASREANACLIPEVPFDLDAVFRWLDARLDRRGHAVIVVAEGAGQGLLAGTAETDASGNRKLGDVGPFLQRELSRRFIAAGKTAAIRYADPGYLIRSVVADAGDALYCAALAQSAVHGAMAGYTGFVAGLVNNHHVWLPVAAVANGPRKLDVESSLWRRVLLSTGQPDFSAA